MGMIDKLGAISLRVWGCVLAVVLAAALVWFFWGSEEAALNKKLDEITELASSIGARTGGLGAMAEAYRAGDYAAPKGVRVELVNNRHMQKSPDDIRKGAAMWAQWSRGGRVSFSKRSHTIQGKTLATSKIWVEIVVPGADTPYDKGGWVQLVWEKIDGDWKIAAVREMER